MQESFDTVIIGAGIAGLYTALNLDPAMRVLVLAKGRLAHSSSARAQGGIAAALDSADSEDAHLNDSLIAGGFKNNTEALKILVSEAPRTVQNLMDYGVAFDRRPDGSLDLSLEGGHSHPRVLHCSDATGQEVIRRLIEAISLSRNITVWEDAMAVGIRQLRGGFGLEVLRDGTRIPVAAGNCVLATGGVGRMYEYTSNSPGATGDGILLAEQLGAKIRHMEWIQFHPTAFADHQRECFLLSETMRGDGAKILNAEGEEFLGRYDPRADLAPRDVVCRAMKAEGRRLGDDRFFLDFRAASPAFAEERYPNISAKLRSEGLSLTGAPIPVYPCQHYLMGGIDTGLTGETSVRGLFAVGECAHTGVHGSSRLAGNSMLEDLVFARQIAETVNGRAGSMIPAGSFGLPGRTGTEPLPAGFRTELRAIMQKAYFIEPDPAAVVAGFERVRAIRAQLDRDAFAVTRQYVETRALAHAAYAVLKELL